MSVILFVMETVSQFDGLSRGELVEMITERDGVIADLKSMVAGVTRQLEWLKRQLFGQKSERLVDESSDQLELPLDIPEETISEPAIIVVPEHVKSKPKKGKGEFTLTLPENIPLEEIVHELSEELRICPKTGKTMV